MICGDFCICFEGHREGLARVADVSEWRENGMNPREFVRPPPTFYPLHSVPCLVVMVTYLLDHAHAAF